MSKIYNYFDKEILSHQTVVSVLADACRDDFSNILKICVDAINNGKKIMLFGNGGSAADAQHIATELAVRYCEDRPPIAAIALTTDSSNLTACGNDYGFEYIFARQIQAIGNDGDIAIGISTSGNSDNVNMALKTAKKLGITAIGLSGRDGGKMPNICDELIIIPSNVTARIQEMHIILGHMLCAALEIELGLISDY